MRGKKKLQVDIVLTKLEEDLRNLKLSSSKHLVWNTITRLGSVSFSYKGTFVIKIPCPYNASATDI